ncbi:hypothetical protein A3Q56_03926 [Intoshia linei]|uniref:ZZ-type domain-containing protein n=1 Tax=Intoshia linei TaxID=1819745 RepID=A0A177B2H5_9BILA|nr:hypothetical protein A3Q56_03926 [Intoshia linei]
MNIGSRVIRRHTCTWDMTNFNANIIGVVNRYGITKTRSFHERATVIWDDGSHGIYRAGFAGKYDLLLYDNSTAGILHIGYNCCECNACPIAGMRWKCITCRDINLCTSCYMNDGHKVKHNFIRFISTYDKGHEIGPRILSKIIKIKQITAGSKVGRGITWVNGNDDISASTTLF